MQVYSTPTTSCLSTILMSNDTTFSVTEAQLSALLLESIFYGILLVSFGFCLHALFTYRDRGNLRRFKDISWLMVAVSAVSFCISSLNIALAFYNNTRAFILYTGEGGPEEAFSATPHWLTLTKVYSTYPLPYF